MIINSKFKLKNKNTCKKTFYVHDFEEGATNWFSYLE